MKLGRDLVLSVMRGSERPEVARAPPYRVEAGNLLLLMLVSEKMEEVWMRPALQLTDGGCR